MIAARTLFALVTLTACAALPARAQSIVSPSGLSNFVTPGVARPPLPDRGVLSAPVPEVATTGSIAPRHPRRRVSR